MSSKRCCVPQCVGIKGSVLHWFPNPDKDIDRFRTWVHAIGGEILSLSDENIYKLRRVCHAHFKEKYCCRNNKISNIAVPTLLMPESAGSSLHVFPRPNRFPEQFKKWVEIVGGKLNTDDDYAFYRKKRLCDKHFSVEDKNRCNRLNALAVPSLHVKIKKATESIEKSTPVNSEPGSYSDVNMKEDPLQITDSLETTDPLDITDPLDVKDPLLVTNAPLVPEGISPTSPIKDVPLPEGPEVTISPTSSIVDHSPSLSTEGQKALYTGLDAPPVLKRTYSKIKELPEKCNVAAPVPPPIIPAPDGYVSLSLYNEQRRQIKSLKTQIGALQKRCTSYKNRLARALKPSVAFQKVTKHMTEPATLFTKMQFSQTHKKPGGRRFTSEEKCFSLALYKTSPEAYSFLRQWFTLPSIKMIRALLAQEKLEPYLTLHKSSALPSNKTQVQEKLEPYLALHKSSALPSNKTQVMEQEKLEPYLTLHKSQVQEKQQPYLFLDKNSALPSNKTQVQEKLEPYLALHKRSALPSDKTQVQEKLEPYLALDKSSALPSNKTQVMEQEKLEPYLTLHKSQVQEKQQPYLFLDKNSALPSNKTQVQKKLEPYLTLDKHLPTKVIVQDISEPYLTVDKNSPLPIKITLKDIMTHKQRNHYLSLKQNSKLTLEKTKDSHAQPEPHHTITKKSSVPSKKVLVVAQENLETYLTFNKNSKTYIGKRKATTEPE